MVRIRVVLWTTVYLTEKKLVTMLYLCLRVLRVQVQLEIANIIKRNI